MVYILLLKSVEIIYVDEIIDKMLIIRKQERKVKI